MVASYTELLRERYQGELDDRADKYIHYASDGAKRMQRLINDLLQFSRLTTQGRAFEETDTAELMNTMVDSTLREAIEESGATVDVSELPTIMADSVQLGQVFQNLLSNALKFRVPDRATVVKVSATRVGHAWRFSVADNGIGIETQDEDRIFQMFQRLHGVAEYPGSGIGLALTRKIVERHGGRIWYETEAGSGTTFQFTIGAKLPQRRSA